MVNNRDARFNQLTEGIARLEKANEELLQGNQEWVRIFDAISDLIMVLDDRHKIVRLNKAMADALGISQQEAVGQYCFELVHGEKAPPHFCPHAQLLIDGKERAAEVFERRLGGTFDVSVFPLLVRDGRILNSVHVARDISEKKQTEKRLQQQAEFLDSILSSLTHPFYVIDANDYTILVANRAAGSSDITVGQKCYSATHGTTSPCCGEDHPCPLMEVKKTGKSHVVEHVHYDREGNPRNIEIHSYPITSPDGKVSQVIEYALDITERRQAEARLMESERTFRSLFDSASDLIHLLDKDGTILRTNPASFHLLGYSEDEMVGKAFSDFCTPSSQQSFKQHFPTFVKEGRCLMELELGSKDGRVMIGDCSASTILNAQGEVTGIVAFLRDATERKHAEKERDSLREQLFQAQKMEAIGTLAGAVAHDFNNMLQIILASTDLLIMHKGKNSLDLRNLETIRKTAKEARSLVKRLLAFSRRDQGNPRPVDLNQHLENFQKTAPRIIPKMIDIEIRLADDLNTVNADPIQLNQLLVNLMINARDAMPRGGTLTIEARNATLDEDYCRTHLEAKPGGYVLLKISDTGHGMEKEMVDHIFEPFYTTKKEGEGTGLGLSIVYGIVKNHNGHITCSSEPGQGTTFCVYLPVGVGETEPDMAATAGEMTAFGTETILVVDDEQRIRKVLEEILTRSGYRVLTAEDGYEALEVYRGKRDEIGLVILDLIMPGMEGAEVLDAILKINGRARVLIASGYSTAQSGPERLAAGASGFIAKPFDARELLRAARRVLDDPRSQGSTITGRLPVQDFMGKATSVTSAFRHPEPVPDSEASYLEEFPRRLRILIIDDREPYLKMLEAGLTQFGQIPLTASSGFEALRTFQGTQVDVVVCDLGMPGLGGWEVSRRIKEICREKKIPKPPFVLLTGETDMEDADRKTREKMERCGADAIVGKPIDIPDLLELIENIMKGWYDDNK